MTWKNEDIIKNFLILVYVDSLRESYAAIIRFGANDLLNNFWYKIENLKENEH
jgi:hypothetical protein